MIFFAAVFVGSKSCILKSLIPIIARPNILIRTPANLGRKHFWEALLPEAHQLCVFSTCLKLQETHAAHGFWTRSSFSGCYTCGIIPFSNWLMTMVSFRPLRIGLWDPFLKWPWLVLWGGGPSKVPRIRGPVLGWSSKYPPWFSWSFPTNQPSKNSTQNTSGGSSSHKLSSTRRIPGVWEGKKTLLNFGKITVRKVSVCMSVVLLQLEICFFDTSFTFPFFLSQHCLQIQLIVPPKTQILPIGSN